MTKKLLAAAAVMLTTGSADAAPVYDISPGTSCEIRDFESPTYANNLEHDFYGRICNSHGSHGIKVSCPVRRTGWDAVVSEAYGGQWSVQVTKRDSGSFNWDCTAYARDAEGDAYWYGNANPSNWHLGAGNYSYQAQRMTVNRFHRYGYTHFMCVIPAGECLAGYRAQGPGSCSGNQDCG